MGFPPDIAERVLVDCGRCCVICHKFCGTKIELHHIKQVADGGENTYENCIPLCFDCHAEVKAYNPKHPKGRKYSDSELVAHRNKWYEKERNIISTTAGSSKKTDSDTSLFAEIQSILSDENVPFLFHYNYHLEVDGEVVTSLNVFIDKCYDPNFEFFDADMEAHKVKLLICVEELTHRVYSNTTYVNGKHKVDEDAQANNPVQKAILSVKSSFDDFIRLGRRKF